jgi:hypothetical protein
VQVTPAQRLIQVLFRQTWPAGQALPHLPQLFASLLKLVQVPLQQVCPLEQQATAPPGAMQSSPPVSLQAPQALTQF